MLETREVEINPETSKNEILNSSSNTNSTINIINNPNEVLTIKPKVPISKFETLITNAYKNLVGFSEGVSIQENKEKKSKKELKIQLEEAEK